MPQRVNEDDTTVDADDIISRVYDVALDIERFDELLESWEVFIGSVSHISKQHNGGPQKFELSNHFERAVTLLDQLTNAGDLDEINSLVARFENVAAFVIDEGLIVLYANAVAEKNFSMSENCTLDSLRIEQSDLDALSSQIQAMQLNPDTKPSIFRVRKVTKGNFLVLQMQRAVLENGEVVIVVATSDIYWPNGFKVVLKEAFELSNTEIEIVRLLIDCFNVKEIAEHRCRSVDTVRVQIKTILNKTETRNQIELVRLILSIMDIAVNTKDNGYLLDKYSNGGECLEALPVHTTYTKTGRRLEYLILGDPDGKPALYITAEYGYSRWTASAENDAKMRGVKIISPYRAGIGKSDLLPENAPFCESIAEDFLAVLDAENIKSLPVISLSDDHHFATQMEKMRPGTVNAIIATAGGLPFMNSEQVQRMHKWFRFIQATARFTPKLLPSVTAMGKYWLMRKGPIEFLKIVHADSPADLETLADAEVQEAILVGAKSALTFVKTYHDTYVRQTLFEQEPWLIDHVKWLEGRLPVHFLVGHQDPANPIETLEEQKIEFPWIDFREYEDAGQLLFFKHWPDVFDLLEEYL